MSRALLIFSYLVVVPSAALILVRQFWWVMAIAPSAAILSTFLGFYWSFSRDLPPNQTIAVTTCIWFALALVVRGLSRIYPLFLSNRGSSTSGGRMEDRVHTP